MTISARTRHDLLTFNFQHVTLLKATFASSLELSMWKTGNKFIGYTANFGV